jgi:hypothetical protein
MLNNLPLKKLNLNLELPLEWLEKIETLAQQKRQTVAEIITDLIGQNLGLDLHTLKLNRLAKQNQQLEDRLKVLENQDYQLEKLNYRLEILEKLVAQLQTQKFSARSSLLNLPINDDDEIEDEPDEILTDFLLD